MPLNYPNLDWKRSSKKTNLIISAIYSITCKNIFHEKPDSYLSTFQHQQGILIRYSVTLIKTLY